MADPLPLGLLDQGWQETTFPDAEVLSRITDVAQAADELGYGSFWLGEHHGVPKGAAVRSRFPVPELVLASLAARTSRLRVGTGIKVLRTTNSFRSAEEIASLDLVAGGRAEFGIGLGSSPTPMTPAEKQADFRARFDDLLAHLAGEGVGDYPPLSPVPPPELVGKLWAAPRDPATLEYIALRGINLVVGQAELAEVQAEYVSRYRAAGGTGSVRGVRLVYVAPTREQAIAEVRSAAEFYFEMMGGVGGYTGEAMRRGLLPQSIDSFEQLLRAANFIVGSPEDVAAGLVDYVATTGVDRLDIMARIPYLSLEQVLRTITLVRSEIAPALTATA